MDNTPSSFIYTLNNSISAIRKKRYDLVIIFGNRILSDLVILEKSMPSATISFLSFIGLFLRRVGSDLLNLSQSSRDTAKLKQRAVTSISKIKEILSSYKIQSFSKVLGEYQEYIEAWANEVNENDFSEYLRNGELDESVFQWALKTLGDVSEKQILGNTYSISAIDNELSRMSYEEKLSARTIMLSISLRGLEWFLNTTNQVLNMLRTSSIDKDISSALSSELPKQVIEFSNRVVTAFGNWKGINSEKLNEELLGNLLALNSDILLSWRKLLNTYYQFQTGFTSLPKRKSNEEMESEGQEDDKSILT